MEKFNVDLEKMEEIYGEEIIEIIHNNEDIIEKNINTLKKLGFDDIEGVFERCLEIFMNFPKTFETKIKKIIEDLGQDYAKKIENDISILENII